VAFECEGQIEILPVQYIDKKSGPFVEAVKCIAEEAYEKGVMILCVHVDADAKTDINAFERKIDPAFTAVNRMNGNHLCKNLVAIVPVQMVEAWMMSDKALLKSEIGTAKSDYDLGIEKVPEAYADPKSVIENAIRTARQDVTKRRRRKLTISDLYSAIGQKLSLDLLGKLNSYQKFKNAVRNAFIKLSYLRSI
jgi:hypothetical protein